MAISFKNFSGNSLTFIRSQWCGRLRATKEANKSTEVKLEGWHYIVECRWRSKLADIRELDGLSGQVERSGKQTMALFLSINGWSDHVPGLLKQNPSKTVLLMDGYDLRCVLARQVDLLDLLLAKVAKLNLEAEPFLSARELCS